MYLRGYRPNQAQERGVYGSRQTLGAYSRPNQAQVRGVYGRRTVLGDASFLDQSVAVNPTLALLGIGALVAAALLFGPAFKETRIRRLHHKGARLAAKVRRLEGRGW